MKALLLNGSPRRGNTYTALKSLAEGFSRIKNLEVSQIDTTSVSVAHCIACEYCKDHNRCAVNDDTNAVISAVAEADILIFATPVYWWGISAQLKVIIDKFYSQQKRLGSSKKQVGLIITGQLAVDNPQYEIISKQFECICEYLGWDLIFCNTYSAYAKEDLAKNKDALSEIQQLWKKIR